MEPKITHILFTSDLSKGSRYVFEYAVAMAQTHCARMTILHVLEGTGNETRVRTLLGGFLNSEELDKLRGTFRDEALVTLAGKLKHSSAIRAGLKLACPPDQDGNEPTLVDDSEIIVSEGVISEEIMRMAEDRACDLVILGTHHQSRLAETIMGSVSHETLRRLNIPMMVVPIPDEYRDED